jgi:hypothetical protein
MKRLAVSCLLVVLALGQPAMADEGGYDEVGVGAATTPDAVRVTVIRMGGAYSVGSVSGGGAATQRSCSWTVLLAPGLEDAPYGTSVGPRPDPEAQFALLLCNGGVTRGIWIAPSDILDVDAVASAEVERYVTDVLMPAVTIGINPDAKGLVGLRSWFWIEGFAGVVQAPTINVFGLAIDVRMTSNRATWDFGDGVSLEGDLGRAYPAESTVQHAHRDGGSYVIGATIHLVPEYRVDGGPWITLPELTPTATTDLEVEEREPVITEM